MCLIPICACFPLDRSPFFVELNVSGFHFPYSKKEREEGGREKKEGGREEKGKKSCIVACWILDC